MKLHNTYLKQGGSYQTSVPRRETSPLVRPFDLHRSLHKRLTRNHANLIEIRSSSHVTKLISFKKMSISIAIVINAFST